MGEVRPLLSSKTDPTPIELNHMKKFLITAAIVLSCGLTVAPRASAQSASLQFTGVPASVQIGVPFTVGINILFSSGLTFTNMNGLSFWLVQNGSGGLLMTDRQIGASIFNDLQTSNFNLFGGAMGGGIPEILDPINRQGFAPPGNQINTDMGALSGPPQLTGVYFLANVTFMATAPGNFSIANTTAATPGIGGRISVITDSNGNTLPISLSSTPLITVVPEPSSIALLCVGLMAAGAVAYRRRSATR